MDSLDTLLTLGENDLSDKLGDMPPERYWRIVVPWLDLKKKGLAAIFESGLTVELLKGLYVAAHVDRMYVVWPSQIRQTTFYGDRRENMSMSDPDYRWISTPISNWRLLRAVLRTCIELESAQPLRAMIDLQSGESIYGNYYVETVSARGIYTTEYVATPWGSPVVVPGQLLERKEWAVYWRGGRTVRVDSIIYIRHDSQSDIPTTYIHAAVYPNVWALIGAVTVAARRKLIVHCGRDVLMMIIRMYLHAMQNLDRVITFGE